MQSSDSSCSLSCRPRPRRLITEAPGALWDTVRLILRLLLTYKQEHVKVIHVQRLGPNTPEQTNDCVNEFTERRLFAETWAETILFFMLLEKLQFKPGLKIKCLCNRFVFPRTTFNVSMRRICLKWMQWLLLTGTRSKCPDSCYILESESKSRSSLTLNCMTFLQVGMSVFDMLLFEMRQLPIFCRWPVFYLLLLSNLLSYF